MKKLLLALTMLGMTGCAADTVTPEAPKTPKITFELIGKASNFAVNHEPYVYEIKLRGLTYYVVTTAGGGVAVLNSYPGE